jgi:hypothetical protein
MRRHELDPVSLTFGFAFTGLGLLFLIGRADQALRLHWVWPILLLVLGVGILADLARGRDSAADEPVPRREGDEGLQRGLDEGPAERKEDEELEPERPVDNREHPI